jgi:hypothetical protein
VRQPQLQHLGLDLDVISVGLTAWRLPPHSPQEGNAALIEWETVTLPLDHAPGLELPNVGPAAIKVLRQCRSADDGGLFGSRSRDNGDGLSHRIRSCCVAEQDTPTAAFARMVAGEGAVVHVDEREVCLI